MGFQISNKKTDFLASAELYQPSQKRSSVAAITLGGMVLMMMPANPSTAFELQPAKENSYSVAAMDANILGSKVSLGDYCLRLPLRSDLRADKNYASLYKSFSMHFVNDEKDAESYLPAFQEIAKSIQSLHIKKSFVDVNKNKGVVDFTLNLGNHVILTIAKFKQVALDDEVMFTLSYKGELEVADTMPMADLMAKISNIQIDLMNGKS